MQCSHEIACACVDDSTIAFARLQTTASVYTLCITEMEIAVQLENFNKTRIRPELTSDVINKLYLSMHARVSSGRLFKHSYSDCVWSSCHFGYTGSSPSPFHWHVVDLVAELTNHHPVRNCMTEWMVVYI